MPSQYLVNWYLRGTSGHLTSQLPAPMLTVCPLSLSQDDLSSSSVYQSAVLVLVLMSALTGPSLVVAT